RDNHRDCGRDYSDNTQEKETDVYRLRLKYARLTPEIKAARVILDKKRAGCLKQPALQFRTSAVISLRHSVS
ncbi:MAG: hypothetical protein WBL37_05220, partial [Dehalococcoidales bacterium]